MENKTIEIPFGAKDSELKGWEYTIPENMEAEIKDGKIIVKQKESEDERIRTCIVNVIKENDWTHIFGVKKEDCLAYLERQKEQKPAEWSEKDEKMLAEVIDSLSDYEGLILYNSFSTSVEHLQKEISWLKALPERFNLQPKQEWSEEDVEKLVKIRESKSGTLKTEMTFYRQGVRDAFNYKGLRPSWKPSEEQINALERAIVKMHTPDDIGILAALRDILKKL